MNLYKITFSGTVYVEADSEIGAEKKFHNDDYRGLTIKVDKVEEMEGDDADG